MPPRSLLAPRQGPAALVDLAIVANPVVSVVIPALNAEDRIGATLESVFAQDYRPIEIVVVDDGSSDRTLARVERLLSPPLPASINSVIVHQENQGPARARNSGAAHATGQYLAFLDDDDEWLPDRLHRCVEALTDSPAAAMVYSDARQPGGQRLVPGTMAHAPSMREMLTRWWPILPSTAVIRRSAFAACGGFSPAFRHPGWEDAEFFVRLREQGEFIYLPDALVLYHATMNHQRAARYAANLEIFETSIRIRYGLEARALLRESREFAARSMAYKGLIEMGMGQRVHARRSFLRALRLSPWQFRNLLRLLRTFMPAALARALSGRTRQAF
jgi:glycosyltransferase involved in cell wall biosynthesis